MQGSLPHSVSAGPTGGRRLCRDCLSATIPIPCCAVPAFRPRWLTGGALRRTQPAGARAASIVAEERRIA